MAVLVEQSIQETPVMSGHCVKGTSSKVNKLAVPALANAKQTKNGLDGASESSEPNNGSLWQLSAGPAALAQLMIYKAIGLYAEIISLQSGQRSTMVECQENAALAQSSETIKEGEAAKSAAWAQAITMIAGAIVEVGVTAGVKASVTKGATEDFDELSKQTKPMDLVERQAKVEVDTSETATGELSPLEKSIANNDFNSDTFNEQLNDASEARYQEKLENEPEDRYVNKSRQKELREEANKEVLGEAVSKVKSQDSNWESEFYKRYDARKQQALEISQRSNTAANWSNVANGIVKSLSQSATSVEQGYGQAAQAKHRAQAGLDGVTQQMQSSSASDFAQAMSKAYDAELQEVQVLEKIHQANSVNG